ncbi:MAG TPA: LptF/LptG family permease [Phycisphaerales bacterium]|nr:LptF/LptG family permease [Phycisphaerales bacterium]
MKLLDRYIIRLFLTNTLLLLVILCAVIFAVDFSLNFDNYSANVREAAQRAVTQAQIAQGLDPAAARTAGEQAGKDLGFIRVSLGAALNAADLWWPRFVLLAGYLLGPCMVGGLGFTAAQLVKQRELVAILASGISLWRVARPVIITSLALLTLQAVNRELLVPHLAPLLTRDKTTAGRNELGRLESDFIRDAQGRLIYIRRADLDTNQIEGLWAYERDDSGLMTRRISAPSAKYAESGWNLTDGKALSRQLSQEDVGPGTRLRQDRVRFLETDIDPTTLRLRRFEGMANNLSSVQLAQLEARYKQLPETQTNQRRIDTFERIRWGRISGLVCSFLSLLITLPCFLRKEPANMLTQSLIASPITLGAFAFTLVGTTMTVPGLPPIISVFLPAMMLLPLAIAAVTSVRT